MGITPLLNVTWFRCSQRYGEDQVAEEVRSSKDLLQVGGVGSGWVRSFTTFHLDFVALCSGWSVFNFGNIKLQSHWLDWNGNFLEGMPALEVVWSADSVVWSADPEPSFFISLALPIVQLDSFPSCLRSSSAHCQFRRREEGASVGRALSQNPHWSQLGHESSLESVTAARAQARLSQVPFLRTCSRSRFSPDPDL